MTGTGIYIATESPMKFLGIAITLSSVFVSGCNSDLPATGAFATSHLIVEGVISEASTSTLVAYAMVSVALREDGCSSPVASRFTLWTGADGTLTERIEYLFTIPSERACLDFVIVPPSTSNLESAEVVVEEARVVPSTLPPDTVRIAASLDRAEGE
jgi:hypothetical protein